MVMMKETGRAMLADLSNWTTTEKKVMGVTLKLPLNAWKRRALFSNPQAALESSVTFKLGKCQGLKIGHHSFLVDGPN